MVHIVFTKDLFRYYPPYGQTNCNSDKQFLSIIINVFPLWAILTTLIVFVLLAFHRNVRSTKIYDNCTKQNAQFVYHIEIRSGDTSAGYNRRRTTLTIDMFDDAQQTLARIAVPGHVIFGRKDSPVSTIDDDKFAELRVTRLWLYRASRLKKVSTIRLTHSCLEPEARIMIYGVELRTNETDRHKLFFPVMNYITAYGCLNKPNACFDPEPSGSIGAMGGQSGPDASPTSDGLSNVDYIILAYCFASHVFFASTFELLEDSFVDTTIAAVKGALVGGIVFAITLALGIILRFLVKYFYSLNIGTGPWSMVYYGYCALMLLWSTMLWIYTTVVAYKTLCPSSYDLWLLSISVATVEAVAVSVALLVLTCMFQMVNPRHAEHYVIPDEPSDSSRYSGAAPVAGTGPASAGPPANHHQQQQHLGEKVTSKSFPKISISKQMGMSPAQVGQQQLAGSPVNWPTAGAHGPPPPPPHQPPVQYYIPPNANIYGQPLLFNSILGPSPYKTYSPGPYHGYPDPHGGPYYAAAAQPQPMPGAALQHHPNSGSNASPPLPTGSPPPTTNTAAAAALPTQHHPSPAPQTSAKQGGGGGGGGSGGTGKGGIGFKKIGSTESTGSTYYQQLMKNKGGVKSISQYGELLKQKKQPPPKK